MTKLRYRLRADGRPQRVPVDPTRRFLTAARERWAAAMAGRLESGPYDPGICDAHGVHLRDAFAALRGDTTPAALRARAMLLWMGIDCAAQKINEPTAEQALAFEQLLARAADLIKQSQRERRQRSLRLYIREFPDLARAEVASLTR